MKISVIIPAYNEAELLPRALAALLPQAISCGAEVIVIDNNSSDQTAAIARSAGVRVIPEPRQGVVYAMDTGLRQASGDIVAYTDADSCVDPHWLEVIKKTFSASDAIGITGPVQFERMPFIGLTRAFFRTSLVGSNMAVRRADGLAVGGFDMKFNLASDIAFGWRLESRGPLKFIKDLRVTTSARRFQSAPVKEGLRYILNYAWMMLFRHPLVWHFSPVRKTAKELERQTRWRTAWSLVFAIMLGLAYLSAWPSSSVFGEITTHVKTKQQLVALTFDDGPNGLATRKIIDILKSKNVPATFFEVGRSVAADPSTSRYVSQSGFPVENHSWDHSFRLPYMTPAHIRRELAQTSAEIRLVTGRTPTMFRPPHGFRSPQLLDMADQLKLQVIDWTVDPQDYNTGDSALIIKRVVSHVRQGSIVLMHDGVQDGIHAKELQNRRGTIAALPAIIDQLRQKGYTFVTVDQLIRSGTKPENDSATSEQ